MDEEILINDQELLDYYEEDAYKAYIKEISKYRILTNDEIIELHNKGEYQRIIESNLRLVVWVAKRYCKTINHMEFLDIIQEGNIGLMKAVDKYNPERGFFTTAAVLWIRQSITRSITDQDDTIRKPAYLKSYYQKYKIILNEAKKEGKSLTKEEIISKLDITPYIYDALMNYEKLKTTSLNKKIDDDEDSELEEYIPDKKNTFVDDIVNSKDQEDLLSIIKYHLKPKDYYILYYRVIINQPLTLEQIANTLNITRERVRQIEVKVIKELKRLNYTEPNTYLRLLAKVNNYKGNNQYNTNPISPNDIILYIYLKRFLNPIEIKIIYNEYLSDIIINKKDYAKELNITAYEYDQIFNDVQEKIKILLSSDNYNYFYNTAIKIYGSSIYNEYNNNLINTFKIVNYSYLREKYFHLSYNEVRKLFTDNNIVLSRKDQNKLSKVFSFNYYHGSSLHEIERDINIYKLGYNKRYTFISKKALYKAYQDNIDDFNELEKKIIEESILRIKPTTNKYKKIKILYLIDKLERKYYNVNNTRDFDKEKYIIAKEKYPEKFNKKRIQIMDMYYGINDKKMSVSEIAKYLNKDYNKIQDELKKSIETSINLLMEKPSTITINKDLYIPYLKNNYCEFTELTYEIIKYYLIDNLSSDEIQKRTKLTKYKISNIITEAIRKIDLYRFNISQKRDISIEEYNYIISNYKFKDIEIKICKSKYIDKLNNDELALKYHMPKKDINTIISKFYNYYEKYIIKDVKTDIFDYLNEINKHQSETLLNEKERQFLKLYYIETKSNKEVCDIMHINQDNIYRLKYSVDDKIKLTKLGIKKDLVYITRDKLIELLKDVHLPISSKEKEIICYLFEINNYPYKTIKEISLLYKEKESSIRRRYYRSIISIYKYLNKEIPGKIDYEEDILPYLKYFSLFRRKIVKDIYLDNLTVEDISKKYNITFDIAYMMVKKINYKIYCFINNINTKKFDFDYYYSIKDNEDIPFYNNQELAKKIFDMYYGVDEMPKPYPQIIKELELDVNQTVISRFLSSYVLAIYKYHDNIKSSKKFSLKQITDYYNKYKDDMGINHANYYDRYITRNNKLGNSYEHRINNEILYDLIKEYDPNYIRLSTLKKNDIIKILDEYNDELNDRIKKQLKELYGLDSNRNIKKVYSLLNELDNIITINVINQQNKTRKKVLD